LTTIVVVKKGDRAVIGADTLGTYGDQLESAAFIKNSSKLIAVGDSWLAVTGHAAMDNVLRSVFADAGCRRSFKGVAEIFKTALEMHRLMREHYFLKTDEEKDDIFESSQINVLVANPNGIFGVCSRRSVFEYTKFYAFGSGEQYALGAMNAVYGVLDDPVEIARLGLTSAVEFDSGSGAPLEIKEIRLKVPGKRQHAGRNVVSARIKPYTRAP
jgi:ATP-dependent protease HslVU (ClpYQ) peptidase subunit